MDAVLDRSRLLSYPKGEQKRSANFVHKRGTSSAIDLVRWTLDVPASWDHELEDPFERVVHEAIKNLRSQDFILAPAQEPAGLGRYEPGADLV